MKKFLAVLFSVSLLMCSLVPSGFAEGESTVPDGTLIYEFEKLVETVDPDHVQTEANCGDAISVQYASNKSYWATLSATSDPTATLTFTVPEGSAGIYKVQYATSPGGDFLSNMSFYVNNDFVGDNVGSCTEKEDLTVYDEAEGGSLSIIYPWVWNGMTLFEGAYICYLSEGQNTLKVDISKAERHWLGDYAFFADYIQFVPVTDTEISSAFTVEAEDMTSQNVETITGASGGKWIGCTGTNEELSYVKTWVQFPVSCYYDVTCVASAYGSSVSEVSLYLGENKIGSNKEDAELGTNVQDRYTGTEANADWTKQWCNMQEYTKKVWIDAGAYSLKIQIACCEVEAWSAYRKYFVDCISFKPSADALETCAENYKARVTFEKSVSGVALMAAYNGNQLVGFSATDLSEAKHYVETTLQTDETVTKVKVFVWDGTTNCIPQVVCKELAVTY